MDKFTQNCGECRYVIKCYSERASPRNVVINILACRIRNNINSNASAVVLLNMVKPNLIQLVSNAVKRVGTGYIDMDTLLLDLQSRVIESLIDPNGYRIGESAYLTEYLFGTNPKTGWVRKWILWHFSKQKRFYSKHSLAGDLFKSDLESDDSGNDKLAILNHVESCEKDVANDSVLKMLKDIVHDGITLNANEYRVISFCMTHANESNKSRLIDGTHTHLSFAMGVSRPRITKLFSVAKRKLLKEAKVRNIEL